MGFMLTNHGSQILQALMNILCCGTDLLLSLYISLCKRIDPYSWFGYHFFKIFESFSLEIDHHGNLFWKIQNFPFEIAFNLSRHFLDHSLFVFLNRIKSFIKAQIDLLPDIDLCFLNLIFQYICNISYHIFKSIQRLLHSSDLNLMSFFGHLKVLYYRQNFKIILLLLLQLLLLLENPFLKFHNLIWIYWVACAPKTLLVVDLLCFWTLIFFVVV